MMSSRKRSSSEPGFEVFIITLKKLVDIKEFRNSLFTDEQSKQTPEAINTHSSTNFKAQLRWKMLHNKERREDPKSYKELSNDLHNFPLIMKLLCD